MKRLGKFPKLTEWVSAWQSQGLNPSLWTSKPLLLACTFIAPSYLTNTLFHAEEKK